MPKIIRILSKDQVPWRYFVNFPTINISKLNYWLVICIAKNFIWTTLKAIFSIFFIFLHPQIPDFPILSYHNKPYINGKIIYSAFRWCINLNSKKLTLMTGFVVQGHILLAHLIKNPSNTHKRSWDGFLRFLGSQFLHGIIIFLLFFCHEDVLSS